MRIDEYTIGQCGYPKCIRRIYAVPGPNASTSYPLLDMTDQRMLAYFWGRDTWGFCRITTEEYYEEEEKK